MPERRLDRQETDFMREYIKEGVAQNETDEQIKNRRRELAQLFHCSLPQVVGAVAWKKHDGVETLILEPLVLPTAIPDAEPGSPSEQQKISEQSLASDEMPHSSPKEEPDDQPKGNPISTYEIQVHPTNCEWSETETSTSNSHPKQEIRSTQIICEEAYNNREKRDWRKQCLHYIQQFLPESQRTSAHVFHFCAANWYEVPEIYDPLGIPRHQVWGAEIDPTIQPLADQTARRLGTKFFPGDAKELFARDIRFRVVILDFKGQPSFELIRQLPLEDNAILIVNHLRRREPRDMQDHIIRMAHARTLSTRPGDPLDILQILQAAENERKEDPMSLQEAIDEAMGPQLYSFAGSGNKKNWMFPEQQIQLIERAKQEDFDTDSSDEMILYRLFASRNYFIFQKLRKLYKLHFGGEGTELDLLLHNLDSACIHGTVASPDLYHYSSYKYVSPEGHSPFITHMGVLRSSPEYIFMKETLRFMLEAVASTFDCGDEDSIPITLEDIRRNPIVGHLESGEPWSTRMVLFKDGHKQAVLSLKRLFEITDLMNKRRERAIKSGTLESQIA